MTSCFELFMHICLCKYRVVEAIPLHILSIEVHKTLWSGCRINVIHICVYICITCQPFHSFSSIKNHTFPVEKLNSFPSIPLFPLLRPMLESEEAPFLLPAGWKVQFTDKLCGAMIYVWKLDKLIFLAWLSNICIKPWIGLQMFINPVCYNSVKSDWAAYAYEIRDKRRKKADRELFLEGKTQQFVGFLQVFNLSWQPKSYIILYYCRCDLLKALFV